MKYFQALLTHWSSYAGALGIVLTFLLPSLNVYVAAHPHSTAAILIAAIIAAYHLTAPKDQAITKS